MSHCSHSNSYRTYCMVSCMLDQHRCYNLYLRCQTSKCIAWSAYRRFLWAQDLCIHEWLSLSGQILSQTQDLLVGTRTLEWFASRCKYLQFFYLRCIGLRLCYAEGLWTLKYLRNHSRILFLCWCMVDHWLALPYLYHWGSRIQLECQSFVFKRVQNHLRILE